MPISNARLEPLTVVVAYLYANIKKMPEHDFVSLHETDAEKSIFSAATANVHPIMQCALYFFFRTRREVNNFRINVGVQRFRKITIDTSSM